MTMKINDMGSLREVKEWNAVFRIKRKEKSVNTLNENNFED